jgi:hypothetical protein
LGFGVWGLGFGVWGLGFRVKGAVFGSRVSGSGVRARHGGVKGGTDKGERWLVLGGTRICREAREEPKPACVQGLGLSFEG